MPGLIAKKQARVYQLTKFIKTWLKAFEGFI